jgi:putative tryptophan/tyrosine transport system substrate-binding protein
MRRREFMSLIGGAAMSWPLAARAQTVSRTRRIGILLYSKQEQAFIAPFLRGLEALGYIDGKTVSLDYRDAGGKAEQLTQAASELVALNPDVIFSNGGEVAPFAQKATKTIPLVVVVSNDPVESGLVASLGRPGGNLTGLTYVQDQLAGKAVELLKSTVPSVSRVAFLWNPDHADPEFRETQRASRALQVKLQSLEVRQAGDYEAAFVAATHAQAEALIVNGSRLMFVNRQAIGDYVAKSRIIMVGVPSWLMDIGALLSYGPNVPELFRAAATYVDKILRGAKPADLPMQQPTRFELLVNLKTAQALGITVPPTVIALSDKVIE